MTGAGPYTIGQYDYEAIDLATKHRWLVGAPGKAAVAPQQEILEAAATAYQDSHTTLRTGLSTLGLTWTGQAADSAISALRTAAGRSDDASTAGRRGGAAVGEYGSSFEAMRSRVHWQPAPAVWGGVPGGAMHRIDVFDAGFDQHAVVQRDRTLDAEANHALRAHEQRAREALTAFPTLDPAPAATTTGAGSGGRTRTASAGPGNGAVGAPHTGSTAGSGTPTRLEPGPSTMHSAAMHPAGTPPALPSGPAPGPAVLDGGRRGVTPGRAMPTGAVPTGTVPAGAVRPGRAGVPDFLPNGVGGVGNRTTERLPGWGPTGPVAPLPARPAVPEPGSAGRTGTRVPGSGTSFAARLPVVPEPEAVINGRPVVAPSAGSATTAARAGGLGGFPLLGGAGMGAGDTERRSSYRIRTADAFDVPLPPHVDGVLTAEEEA